MAFFGLVVKSGKPAVFVPPPEQWNLHLSQASLPATVKDGTRVSLKVKYGEDTEDSVIVATLAAGKLDSVPLDLFFDRYAEFTLEGNNVQGVEVHLSGYFSPPDEMARALEDDDEDEDYVGEDEDDDDEALPPGVYPMGMIGDDEEDEDEEDDEDEDEEDEDEEDEEGAEPGVTRRPHVVIEEVKEEAGKAGKQEQKGKQQQQQAAGTKRTAETPAAQQPAKKQAAETPKAEQKQQQKQAAQTPKPQEAKTPKADEGKAGEVKSGKKNVRRWENGFEIEEVAMGNPNGKLAKRGKKVHVKYVGRLKSNGKVFDKSNGFAFRLGVGEVIKAWDLGVEGMRVGDKRRLVCPPQLAYGPSGVKGTIPPNATLEFDVELVDVKG